MQLQAVMEKRRSIRHYNPERKVTKEQLEELIKAASYAPSYEPKSQLVLCAHELGQALLHSDDINNFAVTSKNAFKNVEYEANLFAVSLLFNESDFNMKVLNMSNYLLKQVLDYNIAVEGKGYLWNFQM